MRTSKPGAAIGNLVLPPGDSLHQNAMQMLKMVFAGKDFMTEKMFVGLKKASYQTVYTMLPAVCVYMQI